MKLKDLDLRCVGPGFIADIHEGELRGYSKNFHLKTPNCASTIALFTKPEWVSFHTNTSFKLPTKDMEVYLHKNGKVVPEEPSNTINDCRRTKTYVYKYRI
jgi:hypothetical protein